MICVMSPWAFVTPPNDNKSGDDTTLQDPSKTKAIGIYP
jgi:hypothetical protein